MPAVGATFQMVANQKAVFSYWQPIRRQYSARTKPREPGTEWLNEALIPSKCPKMGLGPLYRPKSGLYKPYNLFGIHIFLCKSESESPYTPEARLEPGTPALESYRLTGELLCPSQHALCVCLIFWKPISGLSSGTNCHEFMINCLVNIFVDQDQGCQFGTILEAK